MPIALVARARILVASCGVESMEIAPSNNAANHCAVGCRMLIKIIFAADMIGPSNAPVMPHNMFQNTRANSTTTGCKLAVRQTVLAPQNSTQ